MIKVDEDILVKVIDEILLVYGYDKYPDHERDIFNRIIQEDKLDLSYEHNNNLFKAVERMFDKKEQKKVKQEIKNIIGDSISQEKYDEVESIIMQLFERR